MAETLGSLYDKLSISKIRCEAVVARKAEYILANEFEKWTHLSSKIAMQRDELHQEIIDFIESAKYGPKKLEEPKYKIYQGEVSSGVGFDDLEDAVFHLAKMNKTLWDLEDSRRDKTKSDKEVRAICDDVAKFNRLRNDTMDEINRLFNEQVKVRKNQQ
jgi:hypothetical protein